MSGAENYVICDCAQCRTIRAKLKEERAIGNAGVGDAAILSALYHQCEMPMSCEVDDTTRAAMIEFGRWLLGCARIAAWHESFAREMWEEWQRELLAEFDVFDDEPREKTEEICVATHA
jgi:hypothetical protein